MQTFELKFLGVTILQGVEFHVFLLILSWALQQCSATALPVIDGRRNESVLNVVFSAADLTIFAPNFYVSRKWVSRGAK